MKRLVWKQILVTFAISFVLGAAFGRWEVFHHRHKRWMSPQERQERIIQRLDDQLHLNSEQKQKIGQILQEASPEMEAMREEGRKKFEAVRTRIREQIRPLLTEEQQKKYIEMEQAWDQRMKRMPPPPPPE